MDDRASQAHPLCHVDKQFPGDMAPSVVESEALTEPAFPDIVELLLQLGEFITLSLCPAAGMLLTPSIWENRME